METIDCTPLEWRSPDEDPALLTHGARQLRVQFPDGDYSSFFEKVDLLSSDPSRDPCLPYRISGWDFPEDARLRYQEFLDGRLRRMTLAAPTVESIACTSSIERVIPELENARRRQEEDVARILELCAAAGKHPPPDNVRAAVSFAIGEIYQRVWESIPRDPEIFSGNDYTRRIAEEISNEALLRMRLLCKNVRPRDMQGVDVEDMKELRRRVFRPASAIEDHPQLYATVLRMANQGFPDGSDAYFAPCFLADPHAELHVLECGKGQNAVPVMILGCEHGFPGGLSYADWLCVNERARIHGMALPFQRAVMGLLGRKGGTFHSCRPYGSLALVLSIGGVCDGTVEPGEMEDTGYAHSRWLLEEQAPDAYPVRALGEPCVRRILDETDLPAGRVVKRTVGPREARVCRVEFPGVSCEDAPSEECLWFYDAMREEFAAGRVLTMLVRTGAWTQERQPFYAVFEQDFLPGRREDLRAARALRAEKHAPYRGIAAAAKRGILLH